MTSEELRKKFIEHWVSSPRNHKRIPNVSLVPEGDSTLLFVNSGMFPLAPYLAGQEHPLGTRLCNIQRCLRTKYDEMIEIGDNRHTLMFEMMGNWSLNDYFKKEQIPWAFELYADKFGLDPHRLYASVWAGDDLVGRDEEAIEIWKHTFAKYGIKADFTEDIGDIPVTQKDGAMHNARIFPYGKKHNWWQRGEAPGELGGTTSEIFYDTGHVEKKQEKYHINDDSGRFVEVGNSVFMEYKLSPELKWEKMDRVNIDFGGGFERATMFVQDKNDIFSTDIYQPIISEIEEMSKRKYNPDEGVGGDAMAFRVIADHGRASVFILADGIMPSNKDQGYILRRFIRRLVRFGMKLGLEDNFTADVAKAVVSRMGDVYPHLKENETLIAGEMDKEESKFRKTLSRGLKELDKFWKVGGERRGDKIDGKKAFYIFETFGFPLEMTLDELNIPDDEAKQIEKEFLNAERAHRDKSRKGAEMKFKGGLAGSEEIHKCYHTVTHLLLAGLKKVLGEDVHQHGSNITNERLRFDFNYSDSLTPEQIGAVEDYVNQALDDGLEVSYEVMTKDEAKVAGAEGIFWDRYPEKVKVYTAKSSGDGDVYSFEVCGGPHVNDTTEISKHGRFKIIKEESSSAGIRRIKAVLTQEQL